MTELTQIQPDNQPKAEEADHIAALWPVLLQQPIQDANERNEISAGIHRLTEPPRREWIMARVASLLSQYYAADLPQSMIQMMAEDWAAELSPYPEWAIEKAVRWWKSGENPDRRRRPLEGDISSRAKLEMGVVKVAKLAVSRFDRFGDAPPMPHEKEPPREPVSAERANEIMAEVGFSPKRFGGDA